MTKINIKDLIEKAEKATPGPWYHEINSGNSSSFNWMHYVDLPDINYISIANPQTVLALIAALKTARETLKLLASSDKFREGDYGYQFVLLSKEALTKIDKELEKEIRHDLEIENGPGPVKYLLFEIDALRAEKDSWGNEFNAVMIMKDKLVELESILKRYKTALEIISKGKYEFNPWTVVDSYESKIAQAALTKCDKS